MLGNNPLHTIIIYDSALLLYYKFHYNTFIQKNKVFFSFLFFSTNFSYIFLAIYTIFQSNALQKKDLRTLSFGEGQKYIYLLTLIFLSKNKLSWSFQGNISYFAASELIKNSISGSFHINFPSGDKKSSFFPYIFQYFIPFHL